MAITSGFILPHPPIIVHEVGQGKELTVKKTLDAYDKAARKIASLKPSTIVLSSPHSIMYSDYFHISPGESAKGDLWQFGGEKAKLEVTYNTQFVEALCENAREQGLYAGTQGEKDKFLDHGTFIPLYFINKYYTDYKLVRLGLSGFPLLEHYKLGKCIAQAALELNEATVFIASGDLSHMLKESGPYGYCKEGVEFDLLITQAMKDADFLKFMTIPPAITENAAECGLRSFVIMAGALDKKAVTTEFLEYEGTFGVGYALCFYEVTGDDSTRNFGEQYEEMYKQRINENKASESAYVRLARTALETYIKTGKTIDIPKDLPEKFTNTRAGTFVSLKKHGNLRGCIGTIEPYYSNIAEEIINNAISAAVNDPRFDAVFKDELDDLVYSVDILGECEEIPSASMLDVKKYGVVVTHNRKRGLLLPNLEGIDTVEQQIEIALQKAGINPDANYTLQRFEVVRYK